MARDSRRGDDDRDDDRDDRDDRREDRSRDRGRGRDRDDDRDRDDRDQRDDDDADDDDLDEDDEDVDYRQLYRDAKAEAARHKKISRKHENRAKKSFRELQQLRNGGGRRRSGDDDDDLDIEAAVQDARESARTEVVREYAGKLVDSEIRAQAGDRLPAAQLEAILDGLDRTSFLDDDGELDMDAVEDYVDRIAPKTRRRRVGEDRDRDRDDDRGPRRRGTARGGSAMGQGGRTGRRDDRSGGGGVSAGRSRYQERRDARKESTSS
ncbi:hypothetical protein GCM10009613_61150 [Pseudonocardia kongjuensis]|uniref:Uncharacterized protein n=1 Tax=Pseudonocardia kongjuensis TaxID=102227 RepID=A0ABP4IY27_9PSEU